MREAVGQVHQKGKLNTLPAVEKPCCGDSRRKKGIYDESLLTSRVLKGMEDPMAWVKKSGQNRDLAQM